jgi:aminopeptidase N
VREHLGRVDDALLRNLLWASLWEMVRDARLRSTDYLAICTAQLPLESDEDVLDVVLERVAMNVARYIPESVREQSAHGWFELALDSLGRATGDARIMWARSAIKVTASKADAARLVGLADGSEKIGSFEFDQEMRWAMAITPIAFGGDGAEQLLARQGELDRSDRGQRALLQAGAARPSAQAKEEAWQRIHGEGYGSFYLTRAAMLGFFWPQQRELLAPYVDSFFDRVRDVFETKDHPFARAYMFSMYPSFSADPSVLTRSRALLAELDGTLPTLSRLLTESADELDRQIKVRAFAEAD